MSINLNKSVKEMTDEELEAAKEFYMKNLSTATDLLQEVEAERENRAMDDINKCETDS